MITPRPVINCGMAQGLSDWISQIRPIAIAAFNQPVIAMTVGRGYHCRRRNNKADGKISEHGFANALDILGFKLNDGRRISVKQDWRKLDQPQTQESLFLRLAHKKACTQFTTVLGPDGDENHQDHFHLDLGCHGQSCTYLICQ